jgi:hypothetical protein
MDESNSLLVTLQPRKSSFRPEKSAVFRRCSIPIPSPKPVILSEVEGPAVAFAVAVAVAFLAVIPKGDLLSPLPLLLPFLFSSRRDLLLSLFSFG